MDYMAPTSTVQLHFLQILAIYLLVQSQEYYKSIKTAYA